MILVRKLIQNRIDSKQLSTTLAADIVRYIVMS